MLKDEVPKKNGSVAPWYLPMMFLAFSLISGCRDSATIWSTESIAPDGQWKAVARTEQYGGMGAAGVQASVILQRNQGPDSPIKILSFSNESAYPQGVANLELKWLTPSHLDVGYGKGASVQFQAIKCAGIEISIHQE